METTFLPEGYEVPLSNNGFMKFTEGDNIFRALSDVTMGYEYWTKEDKPVRSREEFTETPNIKNNPDGRPQKVKHFWAFIVWNYKTKDVEVLEITQSSIQKAINSLVEDGDWGDPKSYNINVNRIGVGIDTEYNINPKPHTDIDAEITEAFEAKYVNIDALFTGENPFEEVSS